MVSDMMSIELTPGNYGQDCIGNGTYEDIECCCDECDFMLCCIEDHWETYCAFCKFQNCPRLVTHIE